MHSYVIVQFCGFEEAQNPESEITWSYTKPSYWLPYQCSKSSVLGGPGSEEAWYFTFPSSSLFVLNMYRGSFLISGPDFVHPGCCASVVAH